MSGENQSAQKDKKRKVDMNVQVHESCSSYFHIHERLFSTANLFSLHWNERRNDDKSPMIRGQV